MTQARQNTVTEEEATYHCVSRCVRRAFLYGYDAYTGLNYDHRKDWIRDRLKFLTSVFCIDVLQCALMDNHQHTMLRNRPDILSTLTDEQIAQRWFMLYPKPTFRKNSRSETTLAQIKALAQNVERIDELRRRLGSISWLMKSLNEYLARKANKEDSCKGRFWEGRFKCVRLEDDCAILSCAVYIDLNPIHADKSQTPETSRFASAYERIQCLRKNGADACEARLWLAPIHDTCSRKGFLPITLEEYLAVIDATGRELRHDKRGRIDPKLDPILTRLSIQPRNWLTVACTFGKSFSTFAGNEKSLLNAAHSKGKKWVKGLRFARAAFA